LLADVKIELNEDFDELKGAVRVVGKVRIEEKAKLEDRLLRSHERPWAFADCVRGDVGNPQTQLVCARQPGNVSILLQPRINNPANGTL
jgi:hypothetical protein